MYRNKQTGKLKAPPIAGGAGTQKTKEGTEMKNIQTSARAHVMSGDYLWEEIARIQELVVKFSSVPQNVLDRDTVRDTMRYLGFLMEDYECEITRRGAEAKTE
jgi:hypothetical protein